MLGKEERTRRNTEILREYFMQTQIKMPKSHLERLVELAYLE